MTTSISNIFVSFKPVIWAEVKYQKKKWYKNVETHFIFITNCLLYFTQIFTKSSGKILFLEFWPLNQSPRTSITPWVKQNSLFF